MPTLAIIITPTLSSFIYAVLLLLVGSGITLLVTRLTKSKDKRDEKNEGIEEKVTELMRQVSVLEAQAVGVAGLMQHIAIKGLTNFHTPVLDKLLVKAEAGTLTTEDKQVMAVALEKRAVTLDPKIDRKQQIYARILPGLMELKIIEDQEAADNHPTEIVNVLVPVQEQK